MTVVEGGNRLYRKELAFRYSILGKDEHVQSMRPKFGQ